MSESIPFSNLSITDILPHRYPFLLVDRVLEMEPGKRVKGMKNVTANEPFFQGHFPGRPIMPGVLILEHMAQVGGVLFLYDAPPGEKLIVIAGMEKVRFRKLVTPGDTLVTEVEVLRFGGRNGRVKMTAMVGDGVAAEAEMLFSIVDKAVEAPAAGEEAR